MSPADSPTRIMSWQFGIRQDKLLLPPDMRNLRLERDSLLLGPAMQPCTYAAPAAQVPLPDEAERAAVLALELRATAREAGPLGVGSNFLASADMYGCAAVTVA